MTYIDKNLPEPGDDDSSDDEEEVDDAAEESFPASDPPAW